MDPRFRGAAATAKDVFADPTPRCQLDYDFDEDPLADPDPVGGTDA